MSRVCDMARAAGLTVVDPGVGLMVSVGGSADVVVGGGSAFVSSGLAFPDWSTGDDAVPPVPGSGADGSAPPEDVVMGGTVTAGDTGPVDAVPENAVDDGSDADALAGPEQAPSTKTAATAATSHPLLCTPCSTPCRTFAVATGHPRMIWLPPPFALVKIGRLRYVPLITVVLLFSPHRTRTGTVPGHDLGNLHDPGVSDLGARCPAASLRRSLRRASGRRVPAGAPNVVRGSGRPGGLHGEDGACGAERRELRHRRHMR